jgi:hypothetical protein
MTILLSKAMEAAQRLPPDAQDEIARLVLAYAGDEDAAYVLTPEDEAAIQKSRSAAASGQFASDEKLQAIRDRIRS